MAAGLVLSACGGGQSQAANEPSGNFPVQAAATFPNSQRLAQHTRMVVIVHNTGSKTIPNVAVTICNVTCAYPAPRGTGSSTGAFSANISQEGVANPSRPIWIVDTPPDPCTAPTCSQGGSGGAVTAYSNTWALGALAPGKTATFVWHVTAVQPGVHVVAWEVAAGLNGKAKAVGTRKGKITVLVRKAPAKTYVTNSGKVVSQQ
ncbi:MAG TPA: hypothetical protein VFI54_19905 [Solirubrobacteraceae bacterium]|nr:hypothetical protein [Solirubrobacteraceae bacterium]